MKATTATQMSTMRYDVSDLKVDIQSEGNKRLLSLELPALLLRGPIISQENMEVLEAAGFTPREVETAAEEMVEGLQALSLGKLLQKRRY